MKTKIIVQYEDNNIDAETAMLYAGYVIEKGKVSQGRFGPQYCHHTFFPFYEDKHMKESIHVVVREKRNVNAADSFIVYKRSYTKNGEINNDD